MLPSVAGGEADAVAGDEAVLDRRRPQRVQRGPVTDQGGVHDLRRRLGLDGHAGDLAVAHDHVTDRDAGRSAGHLEAGLAPRAPSRADRPERCPASVPSKLNADGEARRVQDRPPGTRAAHRHAGADPQRLGQDVAPGAEPDHVTRLGRVQRRPQAGERHVAHRDRRLLRDRERLGRRPARQRAVSVAGPHREV